MGCFFNYSSYNKHVYLQDINGEKEKSPINETLQTLFEKDSIIERPT